MANVTVEDVGPCKKQLKITVPSADIEAKLEESYVRLAESAVVAGFRKGRIPRKLLEKRFSEDVIEEVKQALLAEASEKAIEEQKLKPIGQPSFDNITFEVGKDCSFDVTIEVEPEFELGEYKGLSLKRKAAKVSDEEMAQRLDMLRYQRARLEETPEGTAVQAGDVVSCDWKASADGEIISDERNAMIHVRGNRFGNMTVEKDLAEVLPGAAAGDVREVKATFTDAYPVEKWRGKEATIAFTVGAIRRPTPPELNDEFAKTLDFDSMDNLKKAVETSLQSEKEREVATELEQQVFDRLLERTPFDLPQGVLKAQARSIMMRQQYRLRQRGVPDEEIESHMEELRNASEEAAARTLKIYFILERIADKEKIFVTESEVDARIAALAAGYRTTPQKLRAQMEEEKSLGDLRAGMREDKVADFLTKNANIEQES